MKIEIGENYRNRKGTYKVLDIQGDRLFIEYEDGEWSEVSLRRQKLILRNFNRGRKKTTQIAKKPDKKVEQPQSNLVYKSHCWRCGKRVMSNKNKRCSTCGWLKCKCGACGCNRPKLTGSLDPFL